MPLKTRAQSARAAQGGSKENNRVRGWLLGLYWDNGKENGNYQLGFRV